MTTQLPYEPPQYGAYPTAPPWAGTPPPAPVEPPPSPPHGQLLVPYPELMGAAGRPQPPAVVPTAIYTLVFGALGAISAARRADTAARGGTPRARYWIAFAVGMALHLLVTAIAIAVMLPVYLNFREEAVTAAVQSSIVRARPAEGPTVTSASCTPAGARGPDGLRRYSCRVTVSDGRTGTIAWEADSRGNGHPVKTK